MRRFLTLVFMLCLAIPAGISITGCTRNPAGKYCYGLAYGTLDTAVVSINLQPQTTGISLAFGQTQQVQAPSALTCDGTGATVNSSQYTYGTTNNKLVDISPTGSICAGTWNRNTGGGIPDYTYCNFPNPLPSSSNGLPYGTAYVTASAESVTSNPVQVFVHAQVSAVQLVGPQQCLSQTQTDNLDAQACYSSNGQQYLMCAPASITSAASPSLACPVNTAAGQTLASIPSCTSAIGYFNFSVGNATVATLNTNANQITAVAPGTTAINASIAGTGSSAGYFSTCPPKSISVTLANGTTVGTITQGVQQNLTTQVFDNNPNGSHQITGVTLDYQSTNPIDIGVSGSGSVTARFPGVASVYAICQPPICNPSPINEIGLNGTGVSISSNPVNITTPGTISDYGWTTSPGLSQYVVRIDLLTGTPQPPSRLPYVPNSMVMDREGSNLYLGSERELMVFNTGSNTLSKQDPSVPGVVLAVSPNDTQVLINDQVRQLFYLYNATGGGLTSFAGLGNAATWTPDSKTLYVTDNAALGGSHTDTLYIYSQFSGWSTYPLPPSPLPAAAIPPGTLPPNVGVSSTMQTPAVAIPGVGAYLRGTPTVAHAWCPIGSNNSVGSAITALYPGPFPGPVSTQGGDSQPVQSDVLTATTDGKHILSAAMQGGGITLSDIGVSIPTGACSSTVTGTGASQIQTLLPLTIQHPGTPYTQTAIAANATSINQLVASPVSNLAFITYNGTSTGAQLPYYIPGAPGTPGTVGYVSLAGASAITAPLAGAFALDDSYFFVSTAGDNKIHYISIPPNPSAATPPTDSQQFSPNLPACTPVSAGGNDAGCTFSGSGTIVPATAIAVIPRSTT